MPKLNKFDDYDECMVTYGDEAKYCYVKSIIKPPNYQSSIYEFIRKFSSHVKQHYRHDKLTRGICLNKCAELISSMNETTSHSHYEPSLDDNEMVRFYFINHHN